MTSNKPAQSSKSSASRRKKVAVAALVVALVAAIDTGWMIYDDYVRVIRLQYQDMKFAVPDGWKVHRDVEAGQACFHGYESAVALDTKPSTASVALCTAVLALDPQPSLEVGPYLGTAPPTEPTVKIGEFEGVVVRNDTEGEYRTYEVVIPSSATSLTFAGVEKAERNRILHSFKKAS